MSRSRYFGGLILIILGLLFLLGNLNIIDFSWHDFWHNFWRYFWPGVLILLGCYLILRYIQRPKGDPWFSYSCCSHSGDVIGKHFGRTFEDMRIDARNMEIDGIERSSVFGDTFITLDGAHLKPGINCVVLSATFGDITVLVPPGIEVRADTATTFGEINFFGRSSSGISNHFSQQTDGYESAGTKVDLKIRTTFGDIKISHP